MKGYLIPISLATGLARKQSFFAPAEQHKFRISFMKALTAFSVPVPKRSANDAAEAASIPRGMTSSWVKWLFKGWRALACTWLTKERRLSPVISAAHSESLRVLIPLNAREFPLLKRRQGTFRSKPARAVESMRSLASSWRWRSSMTTRSVSQWTLSKTMPVAPVDRNAAAASGVQTPPQMRMSMDFELARSISLAAE